MAARASPLAPTTPMLDQAARLLSGDHPAWGELEHAPRADPGASSLTDGQASALVRWGCIRPAHRTERIVLGRMFATPKSDGQHSRPIYDARAQNSAIVWTDLEYPTMTLLDPLSHVRVGLGLGLDPSYELFEADLVSCFPSLTWGTRLARAHGLRIGARRYVHAVPCQGSALLPIIAQSVACALAQSPPPNAPRKAFVRTHVSILYDNFLFAGLDVGPRSRAFSVRAAEVGFEVKGTGPTRDSVESCGFTFTPRTRTWTIRAAWRDRALEYLRRGYPHDERSQQVVSGLAVWLARANLLPLAVVQGLVIPGSPEPARAMERAVGILERNRPRTLRSLSMTALDPPDRVVVADASIHGAGVVLVDEGVELAVRWSDRQHHSQQQELEWRAAVLGIEEATAHRYDGFVLVLDSAGTVGQLLAGLSASASRSRDMLELCERSDLPSIWVAWCPGLHNLADEASRAIDIPRGSTRRRNVEIHLPMERRQQWRSTAREVPWSAAKYAE